jgi:metallophosphoesterase superfamily enzyme
MSTYRDTVILPDTQNPYQHKRYVAALQQFVKDYQPDALAHVGDGLDAPEPSRWNKGMAGEYAPTLQKSIEDFHDMMAGFRDALGDKPFHFKMGNHDERVETYVDRYAPALASIQALKFENLTRLNDLEVEVHRELYDITPGWVLAHGHEASLSRIPGSTAMGLARKIGKSVVCGHTHKVGLQHETTGYNGRNERTIFGMEVGHAMSVGNASYLKFGGANWNQGFGILHSDGRRTWPQLVIVQGNQFKVDGVVYAF